MAHPYHHALSSAKRWGTNWEAHYPLHAFMDSSKELMADPRHRGLHHHSAGVALAKRMFEAAIPETEAIATQHIEEDLGTIPTLEQWLPPDQDYLDPNPKYLLPIKKIEEAVVETTKGVNTKEALECLHFLMLEKENGRRKFLHFASHGPFLCEKKFGVLFPNTPVPTRYIAERTVLAIKGKIPTLEEIFRERNIEDWMYVKASPLSKTLTI